MRSKGIPTKNFSFGIMIPEISFMAALSLSERKKVIHCINMFIHRTSKSRKHRFYRPLWCVA